MPFDRFNSSRVFALRGVGLFLILAGASVPSVRTSADTLVEMGTFALQNTSYGGWTSFGAQHADNSTFIAVAQYDPAAHLFAQLQSVQVSWTANVTQSYSLTNTSTATTYSFTGTDNVYIFQPPGANPNTHVLGLSQGITTITNGSIAGNTTINGTNNPTATTANITIPGPNSFGPAWTVADLVPYSGSGNVDFDISAGALESITSGNGNVSGSITSMAGGTVTITYTFFPVPEPSSTFVMGLGVIATGLCLRRKALRLSKKPAAIG